MQEIWKDIKDYEGLYQVSNLGRVKSLKRLNYDINKKQNVYIEKEMILKYSLNNKGYKMIKLQKNKQKKTIAIHRLVAQTFIPNPNNFEQVNHIDGNKENNCVSNLEWCNNEYNHQHAIEHNLCKSRKVELIDKNGKKYQFNHLHLMFKFLNIKPNGNYINFINKNKLYKGFYINDIKESD